jgi:lipopolysaccharide heptosyltransferase II
LDFVSCLIIKLGATGDVVRTTPLITRLSGDVTWVTAEKNAVLLKGLKKGVRCFSWEEREKAFGTRYDLGINLEDTVGVAEFYRRVRCDKTFGACVNSDGSLGYTENSQRWFDLSLISAHGREQADKLKLRNRRTYQDLIFEGLGFRFAGETYLLPKAIETGLTGDVAVATEAGAVWPMKKWAYYGELKQLLEDQGLNVNILPERPSLLEHLSDVRGHRCVVGGDTLPMHLALGSKVRCVTLFNCTSPWEIYDYGVQTKIVSPLLEEFFYKRGYDRRATTAISVEKVFHAVMAQLGTAAVR